MVCAGLFSGGGYNAQSPARVRPLDAETQRPFPHPRPKYTFIQT